MQAELKPLATKYSRLFNTVLKNRSVILNINEGDGMLGSQATQYYDVGLNALRAVIGALHAAEKRTVDVRNVLDFGCGFGRVARFLRAAFPGAELTVCDVDQRALGFVSETLGAQAVSAQRDLSALTFERRFDLIWCGSLLTHLGAGQWHDVLRIFCDHLNAGGVMVFTTHGRFVQKRLAERYPLYKLSEEGIQRVLDEYERTGFGYAPYSDKLDYGISVSTPTWVIKQLESYPDLSLVTYTERGWAGHQDVVACRVIGRPVATIRDKEALTLPNFLIIGAQKCGSTWLYEMLSQHPQVFMPKPKELKFFDLERVYGELGVKGYATHFNDAAEMPGNSRLRYKAVGEATPTYLWTADSYTDQYGKSFNHFRAGIPDRVYGGLGANLKLLAMLRNPVDRAISAYFHNIRMNRIALTENILDAGRKHGIIHIGFYYAHLRRWLERYPLDRMKIVIFERAMTEPAKTIIDTFAFLDVDPTFVPKGMDIRYNEGSGFEEHDGKYYLTDKGAQRLGELPPAYREPGNVPIFTSAECDVLKKIYRDDILRLEHLLGEDLSLWLES